MSSPLQPTTKLQWCRITSLPVARADTRQTKTVTSGSVVMDVDNDPTDHSDEWVTPDNLAALIPGASVATATSRNHMKPKGVPVCPPEFSRLPANSVMHGC